MARTRGKDTLARLKRGGKRRRVVHVFTEGAVTEPSYIDILKKHGKPVDGSIVVEVHVANLKAPGSQRKPIKLVEAGVKLMAELKRDAKRAKLAPAEWPQVWCLFDRDEHDQIETALSRARSGDIHVAFSHPCFEVWRLLHYKAATGTFDGVCDSAAGRLPFAATDPHPKVVREDQVHTRYQDAKNRAQAMNSQHSDHKPLVNRDPYTDVWKFVEHGMGIATY
jgi:RloB-like protein